MAETDAVPGPVPAFAPGAPVKLPIRPRAARSAACGALALAALAVQLAACAAPPSNGQRPASRSEPPRQGAGPPPSARPLEPGPPPPAPEPPSPRTEPSAGPAAGSPESLLLAAVNRERARRGVPPLAFDRRLAAAAAAHSRAMAERDFFDHCDPDTGSQPWKRAEAAGYLWRAVAENVAAGQADAGTVVERWMESRGHRDNLLSPRFRDAGAGYVADPDDRADVRLDADGDCDPDHRGGPYHHYWTMLFGTMGPVDPGS